MIKDITIGQYIHGNSILHRMDPMLKLISILMLIIVIFIGTNIINALIVVLFTVILYLISGIPFRIALKNLKPIWPIIVLTAVLNVLFVSGGETLFVLFGKSITTKGLIYGAILALRLISLILISSLLTYTTTPVKLTDAIERLLSPLKKINVPVSDFALMMSIALRFIPTLIEETDKIMSAQKSRGASLDSGKLPERIKALVPVLIPLFVSSFRRADELALAMECRCYNGGKGKTRMHPVRITALDIICFGCIILFCALIICISSFSKAVI